MSETGPIDEQKPESMSGHDSLYELLAEKPASQKSDIEEKESQVEEEAKVPEVEPEYGEQTSHLFAVRTTGGQEKIVMRLLEAKMKMDQKDEEAIQKAENREKFKQCMDSIGIPTAKGGFVNSYDDAINLVEKIGFPIGVFKINTAKIN